MKHLEYREGKSFRFGVVLHPWKVQKKVYMTNQMVKAKQSLICCRLHGIPGQLRTPVR